MTGFAAYWSLLPVLQAEWHMSNAMAGWLSGAFFGGYVLVVAFLTAMTDRVDARYVFILGAALSAAGLVGLALLATGFWSALPWRVIAGAGLAGTYMPGLKVLTDRLPQERDPDTALAGRGWDTLNLIDAKTGPRRVFLNEPARAILERRPRSTSAYVFPAPSNSGRPLSHHLPLWRSVRREAGIEDVRLHDFRHTFASHAVLQGIPLPVVSSLLGHKRPSMTLRYAHVGDRETEAAAERIGATTEYALDGLSVKSCG